jgi:hypothetical protein
MMGIIGKFFQNPESGLGQEQENNSGFKILTRGYQIDPNSSYEQPPLPRGGSSARRPAPNIVYYPVFVDPQNK